VYLVDRSVLRISNKRVISGGFVFGTKSLLVAGKIIITSSELCSKFANDSGRYSMMLQATFISSFLDPFKCCQK